MTSTEQTENAPTVLVVDDEREMRMLARAFLQRGGFNVVGEADDGAQAIERFQQLSPRPSRRSSSSTTACPA